MHRNRITIFLITLILTTISSYAVPFGANMHGDEASTKALPLWALHKYKYTDLLRNEPLSWCPFKSYLLVDKYVEVTDKDNKNWLIIKADLIALTKEDADYNRTHAIRYKGKPKKRLKQIYRYCRQTEYVAHIKTARQVFETRQGDCAGIASAFYVLCKANRIPCRYIIGWTTDGCHAWNSVRIKGRWYYVDATLGIYMKRKLPKGWSIMEQW